MTKDQGERTSTGRGRPRRSPVGAEQSQPCREAGDTSNGVPPRRFDPSLVDGERSRASSGCDPAEIFMKDAARKDKLAAIRQRIEAGEYDSREVIERVVDRLLEKWGLVGTKVPPDRAS